MNYQEERRIAVEAVLKAAAICQQVSQDADFSGYGREDRSFARHGCGFRGTGDRVRSIGSRIPSRSFDR